MGRKCVGRREEKKTREKGESGRIRSGRRKQGKEKKMDGGGVRGGRNGRANDESKDGIEREWKVCTPRRKGENEKEEGVENLKTEKIENGIERELKVWRQRGKGRHKKIGIGRIKSNRRKEQGRGGEREERSRRENDKSKGGIARGRV